MEAGLNEALNKRVASKLWKDAVAKLQDQKKQLEKYRSEYETLESTLKTLPSKIKHTVMVPLGTMGMMPGHIYHTNEVLVLLGENYFAKRYK
jgi:prefoldin subunit 5